MSTWGARTAVIAVFLLGFVSGGAAMHLYRLRMERRLLQSEAPLASIVVLQLDRELDLSAEQEAQVREIVMQIRNETISEMRDDVTPKIISVMDLGRERLSPVLDAQQRARLDEMYRERRAFLERQGAPRE